MRYAAKQTSSWRFSIYDLKWDEEILIIKNLELHDAWINWIWTKIDEFYQETNCNDIVEFLRSEYKKDFEWWEENSDLMKYVMI